ncbi:MAG: hypothetical protein A4E37_01721 [Methanoregulaceae archaeon PtaB.Bin056]|nr:MAG: hypothetical protein A4E37_01721 [Methanoregulaceae archaeon PtaB.Bin056]
MNARCALLWDEKIVFSRLLEECGLTCEHVTPHLLAAPFYRGRYSTLIIPAGFANPAYSRLLPALRASSARIRRYVESGGKLIVFGPGIDRADAYDWLPFDVTYCHLHQKGGLECVSSHRCASLFAGYDPASIESDGYFSSHAGEVIATMGEGAVLIRGGVGGGEVVATTIHEYPSRAFLGEFCRGSVETFL